MQGIRCVSPPADHPAEKVDCEFERIEMQRVNENRGTGLLLR